MKEQWIFGSLHHENVDYLMLGGKSRGCFRGGVTGVNLKILNENPENMAKWKIEKAIIRPTLVIWAFHEHAVELLYCKGLLDRTARVTFHEHAVESVGYSFAINSTARQLQYSLQQWYIAQTMSVEIEWLQYGIEHILLILIFWRGITWGMHGDY